jgi:hypothetical protein
MVEKQFGTILELDHCYTCLLQKFLSLLLKVFHFGNKLLCRLEGFGSCVHSSDCLNFDLCGGKKRTGLVTTPGSEFLEGIKTDSLFFEEYFLSKQNVKPHISIV